MRYFSMFSGIGGFELGIQKAIPEAECVGYSEIDKYAIQIYNKHFGGHKNYGNAKNIKPDELPDFDLLCGGFPCQAFSIAGKRRGFEDTRGTLFFEIARILEIKRPKIVLLENVKGLLNHNKGKTFKIIIQTLSELGYDVQWMVLNSKFFGVPQNRERVFIIGSLRGMPKPEILPFRKSNETFNELYRQSINTLKARHTADANGSYVAECKQFPQEIEKINCKNGNGVAVMDLYNKKEHVDRTPALTEPHHNTLRVREGMKIRRLTPLECERLQSFPDGWTEGVSDTQRYKTLGNAVTVNVIEAIIRKIMVE